MKILMTREPFNFRDESVALLIARYFVEPGNEDYVQFDLRRSQDMETIKTLFQKFVGSYQLYDEQTEEELATDLVEV